MPVKNVALISISFLLALAVSCSQNRANAPDVKSHVVQVLEDSEFKDISVDVDKDKQLVTLKGDVKTQDEKQRAEQLAKDAAHDFVISNQLGVRPEGSESQAQSVDKNLDQAIEKEFKAKLIENRLDNRHISYSADNGVLTLKGKVHDEQTREKLEHMAAAVSNVRQVVNELDVTGPREARKTRAAK